MKLAGGNLEKSLNFALTFSSVMLPEANFYTQVRMSSRSSEFEISSIHEPRLLQDSSGI